jgi:hypothetical protein
VVELIYEITFFTVREILPELINQILVLVSSDEDEQQEVSCQMESIHVLMNFIRPLVALLLKSAANLENVSWEKLCQS